MTRPIDPFIGQSIDRRFKITHRLGAGGMGAVYAAVQESMGREVAIKVIHPELATDVPTAKRFLREAWLASRLSSPNIVSIHDFGRTDGGTIYMVMEKLEGRTVAEELRQSGPIDPLRAAQIAMGVCSALEIAHAAKVVHRDLKPANIMTSPEGVSGPVKVLDFGLAKSMRASMANDVTAAGAVIGTSRYIAPELILGSKPAATSDLYSLGAVLYTMLAGRQPFLGDDLDVLRSHVVAPPPPLPTRIPEALRDVVFRLLSKSAPDRFQNARETREAIAVALSAPQPLAHAAAVDLEIDLDEPTFVEVETSMLTELELGTEFESVTQVLDELSAFEISSPRRPPVRTDSQPQGYPNPTLQRHRLSPRGIALSLAFSALALALAASLSLAQGM